MISNSGSDERRRISGGVAGDQYGNEWAIINWYNRPWTHVLRHPDKIVREKIAELTEQAAKNDNIGYNQANRYSYWNELQKVGFNPSKINVRCDADCSAGVIANTKAVGYLLNLNQLKNLKASYTGDMIRGFKAAGFEVLTDSKLLVSDKYLLRGDILLYLGHHTATNLTNGVLVDIQEDSKTGWEKKADKYFYRLNGHLLKDKWQCINNRWYAFNGAGEMITGWFKSKGDWYYLNPADGAMLSGQWIDDDNKEYYLTKSGIMAKSCYIKNKNAKIDMYYWVDENGVYNNDYDTITPNLDKYEIAE